MHTQCSWVDQRLARERILRMSRSITLVAAYALIHPMTNVAAAKLAPSREELNRSVVGMLVGPRLDERRAFICDEAAPVVQRVHGVPTAFCPAAENRPAFGRCFSGGNDLLPVEIGASGRPAIQLAPVRAAGAARDTSASRL